ncbi:gamma-glutamylcyclotransferase family protein [Streptomyces fragilis]|uniref:Gamma-glutamylcyclotransferase family protein n=1 Tax=Streptomyces fragilis TaxID=67301 RepID=A0ABV2YJ52_9ACTN|nr:gamma-glutamylcyclotransferase family protein [Streptomyces fragilis]
MSPRTERLPVFVYGTLRPGGFYHPSYLLGRTTAEEPATLRGAVLHEGPGYPYALEQDGAEIGAGTDAGAGTDVDVEPGVVHGELMTLVEDGYERVLDALDQLEEYRPGDPSSLYLRAVRDVTRTRDGETVRAWVYLAAPRLAARLRAEGRVIAGGDWFTR